MKRGKKDSIKSRDRVPEDTVEVLRPRAGVDRPEGVDVDLSRDVLKAKEDRRKMGHRVVLVVHVDRVRYLEVAR